MNEKLLKNLNNGINDLNPYKPGKPISEVMKEYGLTDIIKLASNENPLGASKKVLSALKGLDNEIHLYPDGSSVKLKTKISEIEGVSSEHVIVGNGSNEILELCAKAFINSHKNAIASRHSFAVYKLITQSLGTKLREVPTIDWSHDLENFPKYVDKDTSIIFIANPNNPTGTYNNHDQVVNLLKNVGEDILVVLDCAYYEYVEKEDYVRTNELLNEFDNLIITKSFSKAHGLASLRVGYGLASKGIIAALNKIRQPFNVNSIAQELAYFSLCDKEHISESVRVNSLGMEFLEDEFSRLNIKYIDSVGNFISFKTKRATHEIYEDFLKNGIIIRPIESYDMPNFLRVTIGTASENSAFIETLEQLL